MRLLDDRLGDSSIEGCVGCAAGLLLLRYFRIKDAISLSLSACAISDQVHERTTINSDFPLLLQIPVQTCRPLLCSLFPSALDIRPIYC